MFALLGAVPNADVSKITSYELGTDDLSTDDLAARPDLCFVDGEHTNEAAFRDGRFCLEALAST